MAGGLSSVGQSDWGGGIFRGRNAPRTAVYNAVNALVNDERELFKRGGDSYFTAANFTALGLAVKGTIAGQRVVMWDASRFAYGAAPTVFTPGFAPPPFARGATLGDVAVFPVNTPGLGSFSALVYAGSLKSAVWNPVSVTRTNGSKTVTIPGGGALANVDPGSIMQVMSSFDPHWFGVVESVDNDTTVTLSEPFAGTSGGGDPTVFSPVAEITPISYTVLGNLPPGFVATAGYRLLFAVGNRIAFTEPNDPWLDIGNPAEVGFTKTNFHELPADAVITGIDGLGATAIVFTTDGVWAIANLDLDPVDAQGNDQHTFAQISKDVILWGDPGIAGWEGQLLAPAVDDVYLLGVSSAPVALSASIRPLYRGYVKAGYQPGTATIHRGHYFLPIVNGTALVDVLVCRLDLRDSRGNLAPAWTRWAGHAAGVAFAEQVGYATRQPKLLAATGSRVSDLSAVFDVPGAATDADGSTPTFTVDTQDYPVGNGLRSSYVDRLRVQYEAAGAAPVVTAAWATGAEGAAFTGLAAVRGGGAADGTDFAAWPIRKKLSRVRFRIQCTSAVTKLILRELQAMVRPDGRQ